MNASQPEAVKRFSIGAAQCARVAFALGLAESCAACKACGRPARAPGYREVPRLAVFLFSFQGRISRHDWWLLALVAAILLLIARLFPQTLAIIVAALALAVNLSATARRLHDLGYTGWLALGSFVPVIGPVIILVFCGFLAGAQTGNEYGPPPPRTQVFAA